MRVQVNHEITAQQISDLLTGCFEGGYSPWIHEAELTYTEAPMRSDLVWWGCPEHFEGPFRFELRFDERDDNEGDGTGKDSFNRSDVEHALQTMAIKYPKQFADFLNEDGDALTDDCFVQCLVFDEVIYG